MSVGLSPALLGALRDAFAPFDATGDGFIPVEHLRNALSRAGASAPSPDPSAVAAFESHAATANNGSVSFAEFVAFVTGAHDLGDAFIERAGPRLDGTVDGGAGAAGARSFDEDADPGVIEFLVTLENHRLTCEHAGNYEEAARCLDKLAEIRAAEEARRITALKARHVAERAEVAAAQAVQFREFNSTWDRYLSEYDAMATMFVQQMQTKHNDKLRKFQEELHTELVKKPVKFGKEVLEWRAREAMFVKHQKYGEAARVKAMCEELERRERARIDEDRLSSFGQREAKFRSQQRAELHSLLGRISTRRDEHAKQRDIDSKRLLQRNKNVMAVLDGRHANEERERIANIKASLLPPRSSLARKGLDSGKKSTSSARKAR